MNDYSPQPIDNPALAQAFDDFNTAKASLPAKLTSASYSIPTWLADWIEQRAKDLQVATGQKVTRSAVAAELLAGSAIPYIVQANPTMNAHSCLAAVLAIAGDTAPGSHLDGFEQLVKQERTLANAARFLEARRVAEQVAIDRAAAEHGAEVVEAAEHVLSEST